MKKYLSFSAILLTLSLIVNHSSAQDNPLFHHISPDANSVSRVDLPSLSSKINWTDLMSRMPIGKMKGKNQEWMELLKDPAQTGIDLKGDVLITSSMKDMDSVSYTTVILHLADTSKFRIALRKEAKGLHISRYPDKSYSAFKNKMGVTWNKDLAVIVIIQPSVMQTIAGVMPQGKHGDPSMNAGPKPIAPNYEAMAVSRSLHTLKGWDSSPITSDPDFKTAFANDADFQMYAKKTNYLKDLGKIIPAGLLGSMHLDSVLIQKNSACGLWFGNGKITARCTTTIDPGVAQDLTKMAPPALNPDIMARLPKGKLLGVVSIRMNLAVIGYMLNRIGLRSKVDSFLAAKKLTVDDFTHAFKGDVLVVAMEPTHTDSFQRPKPAFYFVTSGGDPAAIGKLADALKEAKDSVSKPSPDTSEGPITKPTFLGKMKSMFVMKDNIIVFSSDKETAGGYFTNTEKRNDDMLTSQMKDNPTFIWIDLHEIVNFLVGPVNDDQGNPKMKMMNQLHTMDKMIISKSGLQDGKVTTQFELSVTNKDQNILKTILDMIPSSKH